MKDLGNNCGKIYEIIINRSLSLKLSPNLQLFVNQFKNASPDNSNDPEKIISLDIMMLKKCITLKYLTKKKSLSLFHINACSLNKTFDDLQRPLSFT